MGYQTSGSCASSCWCTFGVVSKGWDRWLDKLGITIGMGLLQNTALLGTARILRRCRRRNNSGDLWLLAIGRQHVPVVRALALHAVAPGSNPVLTSGLDLFPVVPDSTPSGFVLNRLN